MATVPNFYYQSPHIEAAARSLASALAPPDQDEILARETARFKLDEARKAANIADLERKDEEESRVLARQMAEFQPVLGPDGKPDKAASRAEFMKLYGRFLEKRGKVKEGNLIAGPYAPDFMSRMALAQQGYDARLGYLGQQQEGFFNLWKMREGEANARNAANNATKLSLQELRNDASFRAELLRAKVRMAAANKNAAGKPMKVNDSDLEMIQYLIYSLEKDSGKKLTQADKHRISDESIKRYQVSGNPEGAVLEVWDAVIGQAPRPEVPSGGIMEYLFGPSDDPNLAPDYTKLGTVDYGDVLTSPVIDIPPPRPRPRPTPPGGKATPTPAKPPGQRKPIEGFGR